MSGHLTTGTMLKAKSDPKQYRYITLDNGLSAVLVSDPRERATTKEAGVALSVGVGSFSDPPEMQGLAHFLEHMILMGNKKYAGENELDEYLNSCGGFSNAYTECEFTMYYMTVLPEFLGSISSTKNLSKADLENGFKLTEYFIKKNLQPVKRFQMEPFFSLRNRVLSLK